MALEDGDAADVAPLAGELPPPLAILSAAPPLETLSAQRPGADPEELRARAQMIVASIDRRLREQLDAILHHPEFQRMEALWRGLAWLVQGIEDPQVKIRMLDVRWGEIARDLERALDFDQSQMFDLIYTQEFGMPGGEPFGMVLIDQAVSHRLGGGRKTDDVAVLEGLAEVAASAFCPIIVGVDPTVLSLDGFDEIDLRQDLVGSFADPTFQRWNRLRAKPDSRFLGVVMPRLLGRRLHRGRDHPRLGFVYDERVASSSDLLWMSGGFALAHVASRAMARYRWPAAIRGLLPPGEGGTVDGPVRQLLPSDREGVVSRFGVENAIAEEQEVTLNEAGFIVLRQMHLTGMSAFLNLPSLHRPPDYDGEAARMNAKMSAMLNYIFCVGRFAHYVKVIARDWVGKYTDAYECERLLQDWLNKYVTGNDDASPEQRLRYPLREARVAVSDIVGKPGSYGCEIAIRPHYQLDQIASEFRLTTVVGSESAR
ncbi:type VI secretion system contractile sheath large subunit [Sphingomonas radiodurans]|uniref:type VI secretion system contractile sheath large subunit n=1 Tax=Sphingomonas radiodurans TaxID=2890321 RepID=UPI001E6273B7|nr:type VI secretion system contractile sheath large subunit [Sphingomonas radiodurans]WBH16700.1 type VI secretion system contractile sheath large subunit [Sphingomonas radiodurans]